MNLVVHCGILLGVWMFCVVCVCIWLFIAILLQPCIWSLNFLSFISFVFEFNCLLQHYVWCTIFLNFVPLCINQSHDRFVVTDPSPSLEIFIIYINISSQSCTKSFPKTLWTLFSFVFDFNLETIITALQLAFVISTMESYKIFSNVFIYVNEELDDWVKPQNKTWFVHFLLVEFYDECWIQKFYITKETIFLLWQVGVYHSIIGHMISAILTEIYITYMLY